MLTLLPILWAAFVAQTPDSATTARYAAALKSAEDSLTGLRGAVANFRADLAAASPALVLARSARVHARCAGARSAVAALDGVLATGVYTPQSGTTRTALRREIRELRRALGACELAWDTSAPRANADSLRAWGPYRIGQLEDALRRYETSVRAFRRRVGIK